ncbi:aminotransferase class III-fold pyridoxal phosphate-dependent enzyme [Phenylobacterium sp. J426]|uniref:aminotransferase class III-fold pyridoxal phosphate-dependent enzyme n=1 Tax=Phenylobacterium sp. J426 TaxID=2898439 RepID=UPI0021512F2A|nr:aminotransferase class III-fold pyridoxal phosphate-dependent enzyme [Phenylobacterium sp. J426]MCR5876334.1 aminotransferase class III-fold pyridoxal phosphate-dependent enzyme [Phenylobacterium sp. J426]
MDRVNSRDRALRARAEAVIPGGMYGHQSTALLPDDYPQFFERGEGAHIWDVDGRRYLDLMCAYGPNLFGYAHPEIDAAFVRQLGQGDTLTGPTELMVELAEALTGLVSHADWAIFCKNGTDATSMALSISRAHSKRRVVVRAKGAYHGAAAWCTPRPAGVIDSDRAHQIFYDYNDVGSLEAAVAQAGDDLACIFAAPFRHDAFVDQAEPDPAYARRARELCDERGALLVVDEVRAGFRLARDCSWTRIGVQPDLSSWGKCIANGHALSALLGSDKARAAAASVYSTGSFWYQAAPMAAALETLRLVRETDYLERITALGERLRAGLDERARAAGFGFRQTGPVTLPLFLFDDDPDLRKGFCFAAAMLERGVYVHPWHNMFMCAAMTEADIDEALEAADGAFAELKRQASALPPVEKLAFLTAGAR